MRKLKKILIFIFDETKITGYGAWTYSFLKIAKKEQMDITISNTWR